MGDIKVRTAALAQVGPERSAAAFMIPGIHGVALQC